MTREPKHIDLGQGEALPRIITEIPGPKSLAFIDRLSSTECPAITARRARRSETTGVDQDPIVWQDAVGSNVRDVDGNIYVDFTSGFGVASLGHRPAVIVDAVKAQSEKLVHAMGDVYPSDIKIDFSEKLAEIAPGDLAYSILGLNGSDAVAAALKTAVMKTGNTHVISFEDSYHGLFYGPLAVSGYRKSFRAPFKNQLNPNVSRVVFPKNTDQISVCMDALDEIRKAYSVGALIIEPIQGRGGEHVAPEGFLTELRKWSQTHKVVLIFDEIWTGLGRTGKWFACDHEGVVPDLMCIGKSLGGGYPLSALIGTPDVMAGWGNSEGEAIHTATFLGHPVSCAAGLATLQELQRKEWPEEVAKKGHIFETRLRKLAAGSQGRLALRGRGYLQGLVFSNPSRVLEFMGFLRERGFLVLPSGKNAEVLALTPPFTITDRQLETFFLIFEESIPSFW